MYPLMNPPAPPRADAGPPDVPPPPPQPFTNIEYTPAGTVHVVFVVKVATFEYVDPPTETITDIMLIG
jgi:hypothetical protein